MALRPEYWFARPGLLTVCPYVPSPPLTSGDNPTAAGYAAAIAGSLKSSPFRSIAQAVRAMRLASATTTSIFGLRASIRESHEPSGAPLCAAHRTTATAPTISGRRKSRWPNFEVRPSRSLPPLECCRGVRPTQAAKSRRFENVSNGGAKVVIAAAVTVPTPGIVVSRRAVS